MQPALWAGRTGYTQVTHTPDMKHVVPGGTSSKLSGRHAVLTKGVRRAGWDNWKSATSFWYGTGLENRGCLTILFTANLCSVPSCFLKSTSPKITWYLLLSLNSTQWAAVITHSGVISDPPQSCFPFSCCNQACQGHSPREASLPLTTREPEMSVLPQLAVGENMFKAWGICCCYCCCCCLLLVLKLLNTLRDFVYNQVVSSMNRRFLSCLSPLFQSKSQCEAFHMIISFIHM